MKFGSANGAEDDNMLPAPTMEATGRSTQPANAGGPPVAGNRTANQSPAVPGAPSVAAPAGEGTAETGVDSTEIIRDRAELARMTRDLNTDNSEAIAPIVVTALTRMLPRLRTPQDSFQAYLRRFEAKMLSTGERLQSCPDLDLARALARKLTDVEREAAKAFDEICPN
jgi:hypothetical protein